MKKLSVILFLAFICFGLFVRSAFTEFELLENQAAETQSENMAQIQAQMDGLNQKISDLQIKVDQDLAQLNAIGQEAEVLVAQVQAACAKGENDPECVQLTGRSQKVLDQTQAFQNKAHADQAQLRLQMMYYQEFMQQVPQTIQNLNEEANTVPVNLQGN